MTQTQLDQRSNSLNPNNTTAANFRSDQGNSNKGTNGTNIINAKVHGQRGAQKNTNKKI